VASASSDLYELRVNRDAVRVTLDQTAPRPPPPSVGATMTAADAFTAALTAVLDGLAAQGVRLRRSEVEHARRPAEESGAALVRAQPHGRSILSVWPRAEPLTLRTTGSKLVEPVPGTGREAKGWEDTMLEGAPIVAVVAVADLDRAKEFYGATLGLREADVVDPGGVMYACGGGSQLLVYQSGLAGTNEATAAAWEVEDLDAEVSMLRSKGIAFERYEMPGVVRDGDIHEIGGIRAAWFKDPDGNILNLVRRS
jgi:catechol 2,3-dioxygenase-like lactoylglutathione lyase family enzyme